MAGFLFGVAVASFIFTANNYYTKTHQGLIPTKYILLTGIVALVVGIILQF